MRTPSLNTVGSLALLVICCTTIVAPPAAADWVGDYLPLIMGATWTYQNADPPYDQYTESVFELFEYDGNPAVRIGEGSYDHTIAFNDGYTLSVYAEVHGGVLYDYTEDLILGEFDDGSLFEICTDFGCDTLMIRVWDALDPIARDVYEIDPDLTDVILIASYNRDFGENLHNTILASNLPAGLTPPSGAVSNIDWYQLDVGMVATRVIDEETGSLGEYYYLVSHEVAVDDGSGAPVAVVLHQNFPNPFNPATTIRYTLAESATVSLSIHDAAGGLVRTLEAGAPQTAGVYTRSWRGLDDLGRPQASGTYFCRLRATGSEQTTPMTLVR